MPRGRRSRCRHRHRIPVPISGSGTASESRPHNIALYDRAVGKLQAKAALRLVERRDELATILNDFDIGIL